MTEKVITWIKLLYWFGTCSTWTAFFGSLNIWAGEKNKKKISWPDAATRHRHDTSTLQIWIPKNLSLQNSQTFHKLSRQFSSDSKTKLDRLLTFNLSHVIHVQPPFHSSDAKVLTFHDYNILSAKVWSYVMWPVFSFRELLALQFYWGSQNS